MSTYRSPWLDRDRAVAAEAPDTGVAGHYGEPILEQRWLLSGGVVDLSHRAVLSISGPDRLTWLDSISSQKLLGMLPGSSAETLILDPNGRIEHSIRLVDDGESLWLILDGAERETLLPWLQKMKFRAQIEIADRSEEFAVIGTVQAPTFALAEANGVPLLWQDSWNSVASGGYSYAGESSARNDWSWYEGLVSRDDFSALPERHSLRLAGVLAAEALRVEAWRPRFVTEGDERVIPHELDLLRTAVHLNKGCYRGQETVAKVHNLGHPPRRLTLLHLDGSSSSLPRAGAEIFAVEDGPAIGTITTAAWHHELGPVALALIKRKTDPELTLLVATDDARISANQEIIVSPDAGATADIQLKKRKFL
ncbi:MAG: folate-binding protein [Microbacteriaceae bacterium]